MNNYNRMFNKSFDDLSFIKNLSTIKEKYIFVFDFDLTLTSKSSDSINKKKLNYIELFDSEDKLDKLKYFFNKITSNGNYIYINTCALVSDVLHILKTIDINIGTNMLIKEIKGSNNVETINNPFTKTEIEKFNLQNINNNKILWGIKKVIYLNEIKDYEKVPISNIFFFDDSIININTAKINGYNNSFLIGSNDSGIIGLDFLLIKLSQILDLLEI